MSISPAGTYLPPGATAPIADPEGTYSAAGATAPTEDPAGTYSSPDALDRVIIDWQQLTPATSALSFTSAVQVANFYGKTSREGALAREYFAGYAGVPGVTLTFTRYGNGQRPHLLGANLSSLSLAQLQAINGPLSITFDGFTYNAVVNLAAVASFADAALDIRDALTSAVPRAAATTGSTITPESVSFTAHTGGKGNEAHLYVTSVAPGEKITIGGIVSAPGIEAGAQIIGQLNGTPGGVGEYDFFSASGAETTPEAMTETYGLLTVGSVSSGNVAVGERVTGPGVPALTAVDANVSGSGAGSQWIVDNALSLSGAINMSAPTFTVEAQQFIGATENNDFFEIQPNAVFGFDHNPSSLSYASGSAADALGLSQGFGAMLSSPGGQHESIAQYMDDLVNETDQYGNPVHFGSFQSTEPRLNAELVAWASSIPGYGHEFLDTNLTTPPAGSSLPAIDPAGSYSLAGASGPAPGPGGLPAVTTAAAFDAAVNAIPTASAIQTEAIAFEANVWKSNGLSKYVTSYGSGLEFWIEAPAQEINVGVGSAMSQPSNATTSASVLLSEIDKVELNKSVAATAYNDTLLAYPSGLGLGATVAASGNTAFVTVFEPDTTTTMLVRPRV